MEVVSDEHQSKLHLKDQQIEELQKRIESLVLKIVRCSALAQFRLVLSIFQDGNKDEIFQLQTRIEEMNQKNVG